MMTKTMVVTMMRAMVVTALGFGLGAVGCGGIADQPAASGGGKGDEEAEGCRCETNDGTFLFMRFDPNAPINLANARDGDRCIGYKYSNIRNNIRTATIGTIVGCSSYVGLAPAPAETVSCGCMCTLGSEREEDFLVKEESLDLADIDTGVSYYRNNFLRELSGLDRDGCAAFDVNACTGRHWQRKRGGGVYEIEAGRADLGALGMCGIWHLGAGIP